jgi:hypothetical protein
LGRYREEAVWKVSIVRFRTDNSVKNHFYSTLRRGMRRLNRFVTMAKSNYRMMSNVLLSKIVNVADDRFEARKMVDVTD